MLSSKLIDLSTKFTLKETVLKKELYCKKMEMTHFFSGEEDLGEMNTIPQRIE